MIRGADGTTAAQERIPARPGAEPSGKTAIRGESWCTAEELAEFAARRGQPAGIDAARLYLRMGARYGIRGDAAFCQALYETRALAAGRVRPIGEARLFDLWGLPGREELFAEAFVERQFQLLYGFAAAEPAYDDLEASVWTPRVLELEHKQWRGSAPCWEDLNGKWSYPGTRYGQDIAAILRTLLAWADERRSRATRLAARAAVFRPAASEAAAAAASGESPGAIAPEAAALGPDAPPGAIPAGAAAEAEAAPAREPAAAPEPALAT